MSSFYAYLYRRQVRQQELADLWGGGYCGSYITRIEAQSKLHRMREAVDEQYLAAVRYRVATLSPPPVKRTPKTTREELQSKVDKWLESVKL